MWYGDASSGVVALNDETFFSPGARHRDLDGAKEALDEVRSLLAKDEVLAAQTVAKTLLGSPNEMSAFQPAGAVLLGTKLQGPLESFRRGLDLAAGYAWLEERHHHGVLVQRLRGLRRPSVLAVETLESTEALTVDLRSPFQERVEYLDDNTLVLSGAWREVEPNRQLVAGSYRLHDVAGLPRLKIVIVLRVVEGEVMAAGDTDPHHLYVAPGRSILAVAVATNFADDDPLEACLRELGHLGDPHGALDEAGSWHRAVMGRAGVSIGPRSGPRPEDHHRPRWCDAAAQAVEERSTEERLRALRAGGTDDALLVQLADFGRYLLVASGIGGSLPPTLQGIWNEDVEPAWGARWTLNINLQMNLWAAGPWDLPEATATLLGFVESLAAAGAKTARDIYSAGGWVVHHNTDVWRATEPTTAPEFGLFPGAGVWLCDQLWSLLQFRRNPEIAERVGTLLAGALDFVRGWLVEDDSGYLVTSPSSTPENAYLLPGAEEPEDLSTDEDHSRHAWLCRSSTLDLWLIRALVEDLGASSAARVTGAGAIRSGELTARLWPIAVQAGCIGEWCKPQRPRDRGHRHLSSLYGIYPGNLDRRENPELADAAVRTLIQRQSQVRSWANGWGGWSKMWAGCCWARLGDGERAHDSLQHWARTGVSPLSLLGIFPEFDGAPADDAVFQIDANLGAPALLAEMLLQSRTGRIEVLPALPARWRSGTFHGLRVVGGHAVDAEWKEGRLTSVSILPAVDEEVVVVAPQGTWRDPHPVTSTPSASSNAIVSRPHDDPLTDRRFRLRRNERLTVL